MQAQALPIRVLLIEDDEDDLFLIRDLLSDVSVQRYTLEWAAEYDAALEALLGGSFGVCLLDYRLGARSGLDLLREAVSRGCTTPVIVLTGFDEYAVDLESMQAGAADYIGKDEIGAKMLERSIRYAIERTQVNLGLEERVRRRTEELLWAVEALNTSEIFTRSALDALSANITILDEAGYILCTNLSWENFGRENGLADYEFQGINYLSICDNASGAARQEASAAAAGIREVLSGQRELFELEYPCHRPGERHWFNMRVTRFKDFGPPRVVVAHENITVRKVAEEALALQNVRMRAVLDSIPSGVAMYEGEPLIPVLVNPKCEELLGGPLPASVERSDLASSFQAYIAGTDDLYPARSMPIVRAMSGESVSIDDMEIAKLDGLRTRLEVWAAPVLDSSGAVMGAVGAFRDITERKRVEKALTESEENFRRRTEELEKLMELAPVPIFIAHDPDCRFMTCNRAAGSLFQAMEGEDISEFSPAGPNVPRRFFRNGRQLAADELPIRYAAKHGMEVKSQEMDVLLPDGSKSTILGSATPLMDSDGKIRGCIGAFMDITPLKQAEEEVRAQKEILQKVYESAPHLMLLVDRDGRLVKTNRTFNSIPEGSKEEILDIVGNEVRGCLESLEGLRCRRYPQCSSCPVRKRIVHSLETGESVYNVEEHMTVRGKSADIAVDMLISTALVKYRASDAVLVTIMDITERKKAEETLRKSEERFRELAENINEVFWVTTPDEAIYISPCYEKVWGISRESLDRNPASIWESVHPEDKKRVLEAYQDHLRGMAPFDDEFRIRRPDGELKWIRARAYPVLEQGRIVRSVGIAEDITAIRKAGELLQFQRDLAFGLASVRDLREAMEHLLEACLSLDHLDCGGIYLVEKETGALRLVFHRGLSNGFAEHFSVYVPTSAKAHFVSLGETGYWSGPVGIFDKADLLDQEGLTALAVIPVESEGQVVAVLNLASRTEPDIPRHVRTTLEVVAAHMGGILARVKLMDTVRAQGEHLQEANAALKALLKRREEDRKELEESFLNNVKHLVLPYVEKLKKSRLAVDQSQFLEILESHLVEITSPFVRKISAPMLGLTPTEIRVADLIRQGKSSKEIADLLAISEWAVVFHRRGIRRKLGLSGKKLNLQTYLGRLQQL